MEDVVPQLAGVPLPPNPLEVFLLRSLPVKRRPFRPENAAIKRKKFRSVAALGPDIEPVHQFLQPVFKIRQECRSADYDVHVDYQPCDVSILNDRFFDLITQRHSNSILLLGLVWLVSLLRGFDQGVRRLRLLFDFNGQTFSLVDRENWPKPRMFTLSEDDNWREVPVRPDHKFWQGCVKLEGLSTWIRQLNGCKSAGVEISENNFMVILDGQPICEISDFRSAISSSKIGYPLCSWIERLNQLSSLDVACRRDVLLKHYYITQVLQSQFNIREILKSQLEGLITAKIEQIGAHSSTTIPVARNCEIRQSLMDILGGMGHAYYAFGGSRKLMDQFQSKCRQLTTMVGELQNTTSDDLLFKTFKADIAKFMSEWSLYFKYYVDYHLILEETARSIQLIDQNFEKCRYFIKAVGDYSIQRLCLNYFEAVDYGPTEESVRDQKIYRLGLYDLSIREKQLEFSLSSEKPVYSIPLPEHICKNGPSQIFVAIFKGNKILVQNRMLLRVVLLLVDLDLAKKSTSNSAFESALLVGVPYYKRALPPVVRSDIRNNKRIRLEPPAMFISERGITILHKEYLGGPDLANEPRSVRKLALSYIRPKVHGKRHNWLQIDLKGIKKQNWAYWLGFLRPAILTDERNHRIFVATSQTLLGRPTQPQQRKEIAELECYSLDWTARTIKLLVNTTILAKSSHRDQNLQEWRLIRGIVFHMLIQRIPLMVLLHCFHKGTFVAAGKQSTQAKPIDLGNQVLDEIQFITEGPFQPYPVGRRMLGKTKDGHILHQFFRFQPVF